jgi:hypothetical protein
MTGYAHSRKILSGETEEQYQIRMLLWDISESSARFGAWYAGPNAGAELLARLDALEGSGAIRRLPASETGSRVYCTGGFLE